MFRVEKREYIKMSDELLAKYADVLINYNLGNGKGIKAGDVVRVNIGESAKPLVNHIVKAINKAGGYHSLNYRPEGYMKDYYDTASDEQLSHVDDEWNEAFSKHIDHTLSIISTVDPEELKDVDSAKLIAATKANGPLRKLMKKKYDAEEATWCIALYPTIEMAENAGMVTGELVDLVVRSCYLDEEDPIAKLKEVNGEIFENAKWLNELNVKSFTVTDDCGTNLNFFTTDKYLFKNGQYCNYPSAEIFTSIDYRTVNGTYKSNIPISRDGNIIDDITFKFEHGNCIEWNATKGQDYLSELMTIDGFEGIGEFAMTGNYSKIDKLCGEILYDENFGGENGSIHFALGSSFAECYEGAKEMNDEERKAVGLNQCYNHIDFITSNPGLKVIAELHSGETIDIFENGVFKR